MKLTITKLNIWAENLHSNVQFTPVGIRRYAARIIGGKYSTERVFTSLQACEAYVYGILDKKNKK